MAVPSSTSASTSATATRISTLPSGHGFRDGELIEVARVVVVDGGPQQVPEVADGVGPSTALRARSNRRGRPELVEFGQGGGRKIGEETAVQHRPAGDTFEDCAVLLIGGVHAASPILAMAAVTMTSKSTTGRPPAHPLYGRAYLAHRSDQEALTRLPGVLQPTSLPASASLSATSSNPSDTRPARVCRPVSTSQP